jgi:hypothetical protein
MAASAQPTKKAIVISSMCVHEDDENSVLAGTGTIKGARE